MMGKTHMAIGAAAYTSIVPPPKTIEEAGLWGLGLGVAIVSSLLPDIDDPKTTIGKYITPFIPRWLRPAAFAIIGMLLLWHGYSISNVYFLIAGFIFFGCAICKHRNSPTHGLIGLLAVGHLATIFAPVLLIAVIIGYASHLVADLITEGIPLLWPIPIWLRIPLLKTNSWFERIVVNYAAILIFVYQLIRPYTL